MGTKSLFTSVTFWGSVTSVVAGVFPQLFVILGVDPGDGSQVAAKIVAAIGFGIAIYGRLRARSVVTVTGAPAADNAKGLKK